MSTWSACTWAFIHICFFVRHDRSPRSQPVFGCVRAAWNSIDIVRTVGPFARKRTSFSLYCYVIGLFNRPRPNHRHNGKECCSVVSSRFFGGNVAWHPKKRLRRRLMLTRQYTKNPELCNVRCGDEFGLELNWNGALNHVLWFCGGIGAAGMLLKTSFFFAVSKCPAAGQGLKYVD